jgi:hypothetical protein
MFCFKKIFSKKWRKNAILTLFTAIGAEKRMTTLVFENKIVIITLNPEIQQNEYPDASLSSTSLPLVVSVGP